MPNEFLQRIPPPGEEDLKALEQIAESSITPKCASDFWNVEFVRLSSRLHGWPFVLKPSAVLTLATVNQ